MGRFAPVAPRGTSSSSNNNSWLIGTGVGHLISRLWKTSLLPFRMIESMYTILNEAG